MDATKLLLFDRKFTLSAGGRSKKRKLAAHASNARYQQCYTIETTTATTVATVVSLVQANLLKPVLVGAGDVSAIPLSEDEQALMPQHGEHTCLGGEGHEVVHQRVDHLFTAFVHSRRGHVVRVLSIGKKSI